MWKVQGKPFSTEQKDIPQWSGPVLNFQAASSQTHKWHTEGTHGHAPSSAQKQKQMFETNWNAYPQNIQSELLKLPQSSSCTVIDNCSWRFTLAGLRRDAFSNLMAAMVFFGAMDLAGSRFSMGTDSGVESQKPARQQMSLGCYTKQRGTKWEFLGNIM